MNTTKNIPQDSSLKDKLSVFKLVSNIKTKEEFDERETQLRIERDTIMNEYIKNFTSDMIKNLLRKIYDEYSDHIVITLCLKQKYLYYPKNEENFKEVLLQFYQREFKITPKYLEVNIEGPPHERIFTMGVLDKSGAIIANGKGKSKREGEQEASRKALEYFEEIQPI